MSIRRRCSRRSWPVPTQATKSSYRHPGFESCPGAIRLVGVVPRPVPLTLGDWRLDADAVRAAITSRPRAILLNTRHNPTGCVFSASEIAALVEVCVQRDLVCVTNEVRQLRLRAVRDDLAAGPVLQPAST
ncbi:aminotransferase class I/II-fold pyridoxal phosphate-dependent enzyme [Streptomyces sp. NEAU-174]|uniref:aminotransferase class I/II-fold pyridoxal phosphate-dependent enzyme n=1 Tax=Streptomyces sp. NEAU-174 TaxID=3458254 RepID=UPI004043F923